MTGLVDPIQPEETPIEVAARLAGLAQDAAPLAPEVAAQIERNLNPEVDARVYAAGLGALIRGGDATVAHRVWAAAALHPVAAIRRRAAELTPRLHHPVPGPLIDLVDDDDELVAEAACWACGEVPWDGDGRPRIVRALVTAAGQDDPLVREAAVAALGAVGDPEGLDTVLAACTDRPTVRRRAVLALAAFEGPEVEAALRTALTDTDWQTRQAAEDLL